MELFKRSIFDSIAACDIEAVKSSPPSEINLVNSFGRTPIHIAVYYGFDDIAEILLEKGATLDTQANYGFTPLHWGVMKGEKRIVKFLLSKGCNVNARTKSGVTALYLAKSEQLTEIEELLKEHGAVL